MHLFSNENNGLKALDIKDGSLLYDSQYYSISQSDIYFNSLMDEIAWKQDNITLFGKTHLQPRLTALYGNNGQSYTYSGVTMFPKPFTNTLAIIKADVERICNRQFTSVLANLYRDGADSNGWHSDNEKELGKHPYIASISLGATRVFHLKHKQDKTLLKLELSSGSLLVMKDATQENWKHQIPKTKKEVSPRINLTFRSIF